MYTFFYDILYSLLIILFGLVCFVFFFFFFYCYGDHRDLHVLTHSFPTRRSSDFLARYWSRSRRCRLGLFRPLIWRPRHAVMRSGSCVHCCCWYRARMTSPVSSLTSYSPSWKGDGSRARQVSCLNFMMVVP